MRLPPTAHRSPADAVRRRCPHSVPSRRGPVFVSQVFLVTVSGADKPGITSLLTERLRPLGARILDIGQAVIHRTLSLGLLVEVVRSSAAAGDFDALAAEF